MNQSSSEIFLRKTLKTYYLQNWRKKEYDWELNRQPAGTVHQSLFGARIKSNTLPQKQTPLLDSPYRGKKPAYDQAHEKGL